MINNHLKYLGGRTMALPIYGARFLRLRLMAVAAAVLIIPGVGDGAFAFVTNIVDGTASVIDTATRKVIAEFPVGRGPNGITYRLPQG